MFAVWSVSCVQLFETSWTVALQTSLSVEFSRQKYWSELPCLPPGDLPNQGIKPISPALAGRFFTTKPPRSLYGKLQNTKLGNTRNFRISYIYCHVSCLSCYMLRHLNFWNVRHAIKKSFLRVLPEMVLWSMWTGKQFCTMCFCSPNLLLNIQNIKLWQIKQKAPNNATH